MPEGWQAGALADAAREPDRGDDSGDGLLINRAQRQRLRLMPALTEEELELDQALTLLDAALQAAQPGTAIRG